MRPPSLTLYRAFGGLAGPALARRALRRRLSKGKEHPERWRERLGEASAARPDGPVIWLHAASVGEAMSALPLIARMRQDRPETAIVLTTTTVTSAALMADRAPEGVIHQFAPVDTPQAVRAFLDHWRPAFLGVFESELWPSMLSECRRRGVRTALISARLSEKSARRWLWAPWTIGHLLGHFDALLPQNDAVADRLWRLGAPADRLSVAGALKDAAEPLPVDPAALSDWRERLSGRLLWLAASTHADEERAAAKAHAALKATHPGLLTVVAPRHPERGATLAAELDRLGHRVARRSAGEVPDADTDIFLVDALGELGLWYRLAPVALVGGGLLVHGGHNPLEPARLGSAILYGPHMESCETECARLEAAGGARRLAPDFPPPPPMIDWLRAPRRARDTERSLREERVAAAASTLQTALAELLGPSAEATAMAARAQAAVGDGAPVLDRLFAALEPLLPARSDPEPTAAAAATEPRHASA